MQKPRLALYHPEIPQNVGTLLRFCACMGMELDIIEPCGFLFSDKKLLRAGMDYLDISTYRRHDSWESYGAQLPSPHRMIATSPHRGVPYTEFPFAPQDIILMGPESVGLPPFILESVKHTVYIPQMPGTRSLNVAISAAMIAAEALRQTNLLPQEDIHV